MNEQDIQDILVALLTEDSVQLGERSANAEPTLEAVSTFEEAGVASDKRGLVVSTGDGSVFLVTIERGGQRQGLLWPWVLRAATFLLPYGKVGSWRRVPVSRTLSNLNPLFLLYSRVARKIRLLGNSLVPRVVGPGR